MKNKIGATESNTTPTTRSFIKVPVFLLLAALVAIVLPRTAEAQMTGQELLSVTRVAQGGSEYKGLKYVTAKSRGFVNVVPFGAVGLGTGKTKSVVEIEFDLTDYQSQGIRRRLEVTPSGPIIGETYLIYDGSRGGGMFQGNLFRVREPEISRQWAMMGFDTLNQAADGELDVIRQKDQYENGRKYYVVDVKFSSTDTVQYWIDQNSFLTYKVITRYNNMPMVEEIRTDYRKVSCMMLPFRTITKLQGERLADLTIDRYDLETVVPSAYFIMKAAY